MLTNLRFRFKLNELGHPHFHLKLHRCELNTKNVNIQVKMSNKCKLDTSLVGVK